MTTKEVAQICGVTDRTVSGNAQKAGGQKTEESIVKENLESTFEVGRIANENGLKQDPIYGKLGKIQLNNGKWVNQFYYNEGALTVMESVIG